MTDETFKRANDIKEFISRIDKFLYFYERSKHTFWLRVGYDRKNRSVEDFVPITTSCSGLIEELALPEELKEQIIEVITNYREQVVKEFEEL